VLDAAELLDRVAGDRELLKEVVDVFLETSAGLLTEVRQAVAGRDAASVHRLAHTVKGMVGQLGGRAAFGAAQRLEVLGREGELDQADAACAELEGAVADLRPALTAFVENGDRA
jgi:HPt (histidine-containing phosphotransfer) domain-containing protein